LLVEKQNNKIVGVVILLHVMIRQRLLKSLRGHKVNGPEAQSYYCLEESRERSLFAKVQNKTTSL